MLCLLLSFAAWMVWLVVVAKPPAVGFAFSNEQLFWLAALPKLSGATLRVIGTVRLISLRPNTTIERNHFNGLKQRLSFLA